MQKVITLIVSDLSGDEMKEGKGETVPFSYRGVDYTIDLTDKEAAGFDKAIAMYVEHATKTGGRRRSSGGARTGGSGMSKEELAEVRAWAKKNGYEVSDRGRVRQEVIEAYGAAQK